MAAPLQITQGALKGTSPVSRSKAGSARPVATQKRPPCSINRSRAARFPADSGGIGCPVRRASSV